MNSLLIKGLIVTYSRFVYKLFHTEKPLRIIRLLFSKLHPSRNVVRVSPDCIIAGPYDIPGACSQIEISLRPLADDRRACETIERRLYYSIAGNPFSESHVIHLRDVGEDRDHINFDLPTTLKGKKNVWLRWTSPQHAREDPAVHNIDYMSAYQAGRLTKPNTD